MPSQRIFLIHIQLSCVHTEPVYYGILIEHHRAPFPPLFNSLAHTNMLGCKSCFGDQAICMHLPYPPPAFLFFTLPSRESEPDEDTGSAASLLFSGISDVLPCEHVRKRVLQCSSTGIPSHAASIQDCAHESFLYRSS